MLVMIYAYCSVLTSLLAILVDSLDYIVARKDFQVTMERKKCPYLWHFGILGFANNYNNNLFRYADQRVHGGYAARVSTICFSALPIAAVF